MELIPGSGAINELLIKLFGPSCDYLGERLRFHISGEAAERNTARVMKKAIGKVGSDLSSPRAVPPRVIRAVFEEAPYCENEVMAEYLAGVLASSRGASSDRVVAMTATLARLSTASITMHFLLYRAYTELCANSAPETLMLVDGYELVECVYANEVAEDPHEDAEDTDKNQLITEHVLDFWHAYESLKRENLAEVRYVHSDTLEEWDPRTEERKAAVVFTPTQLGADLFAAAHGRSMHLRELAEEDPPVEYAAELPKVASMRWLSRNEREVFRLLSGEVTVANTREEAEWWRTRFGQ